ncbi:MAG: sigma-54 dependent transcriptional regulator [bacterium]|nr:sigma-54 dependent transcriptional regulator [bacterium]
MAGDRHLILIVDDEPEILDSLHLAFEADYTVRTAQSGREGLRVLQDESVVVIIADQRMPGMDGTEFLTQAMAVSPKSIRVMLTGYTDIDPLIEAVNAGQIYRYISKPWEPEEIKLEIQQAVEKYEMAEELEKRYAEITRLNVELEEARQKLEKENVQLRQVAQQRFRFDGLVGNSQAMDQVYGLMDKVFQSKVTVLLTGQTGTGKELLAKCIHFNGDRKEGPFVAQNCGALPSELLESELFGHRKGAFTGAVEDRPGLFDAADGGTVFLDEISETSQAMQVRLLRVLQEGEIRRVGESHDRSVDVRVIAATNQDLTAEVAAGRFREDLYYRLNVFPICVPPLKDRLEDVPALTDHFLNIFASDRRVQFSPEAMDLLCRHTWPGNVRELENEIQRALLIAGERDRILPGDLSETIRGEAGIGSGVRRTGTLKSVVVQIEKEMIANTLKRTDGNRTHAARALGISRWGLVQKIEKYEIDG